MTEEIGLAYWLEGAIVPKARPRVSNGSAYLPTTYREWRNEAELQLIEQGIPPEPIKRCSVHIELRGSHHRRSDADNIAGSILDAMVSVGIIKNDNLNAVPKLSIELFYRKNLDPIASIDITQLPE